MVEEITHKVDAANVHLNTMNKKCAPPSSHHIRPPKPSIPCPTWSDPLKSKSQSNRNLAHAKPTQPDIARHNSTQLSEPTQHVLAHPARPRRVLRMKRTLEKTRSADRFILDFILLIILLGIVGYIISMFN